LRGLKRYFIGALEELKKVQWPSKNHAVRISIITIIFVFSSAAFLALADLLLSKVLFLGIK